MFMRSLTAHLLAPVEVCVTGAEDISMLSRALAAGTTCLEPPDRSKSSTNSVLFQSDYAFPCLLNPELDEEEEQQYLDAADTAGGRDQDDPFDGWDGLEEDISSLRMASNTQRYAAAGPEKHRLVSAGVTCQPGA